MKLSDVARVDGAEEVLVKSHGLRSAAPKYTAPQIEAAAGAALSAGAIDPESANTIANCLALGGAQAVPQSLIAMLEGQD